MYIYIYIYTRTYLHVCIYLYNYIYKYPFIFLHNLICPYSLLVESFGPLERGCRWQGSVPGQWSFRV